MDGMNEKADEFSAMWIKSIYGWVLAFELNEEKEQAER